MPKKFSSVLDERAPMAEKRWQRPSGPPMPRREMVEDFAVDEDTEAFLRAKGRRIRRGLIPKTRLGWIAIAGAALAGVGCVGATAWGVAHFLAHDTRFQIASSEDIEISGNSHVTRSQLLAIFGEDVERNIFHVPLDDRRAAMERMPWVEHAAVMRLLPNHLRVQVVERTPVAFVRDNGKIGLVDANGVLLDIPPDAPGNPGYSFPVVTGIHASEPLSTRAARMKVYGRFLRELDGSGKRITAGLSEIDLSDPEDVKALIPEGKSELLVHFGDADFLPRYRRLEDHVAEWMGQYPRLTGADMRYDRQVVLQMPQGGEATAESAGHDAAAAPTSAAATTVVAAKPVAAKSALVAKAGVPLTKQAILMKPSGAMKPSVVAKSSIAAKPADGKTSAAKPGAAKLVAAKPAAAKPAAKLAQGPKVTAEQQKKIDAIHAWMAKREKAKQAAQPQASPTHTSTAAPVHIQR